jgi:hypothetical protein
MLDVKDLVKLAEDWYNTVPVDQRDKVIVANFSLESMSFTPKQIVDKVKAAARKSKTRKDFLKESGLCAEFLITLEKMHKRREEAQNKEQKGRKKS